jgi:hypothetical protein
VTGLEITVKCRHSAGAAAAGPTSPGQLACHGHTDRPTSADGSNPSEILVQSRPRKNLSGMNTDLPVGGVERSHQAALGQ